MFLEILWKLFHLSNSNPNDEFVCKICLISSLHESINQFLRFLKYDLSDHPAWSSVGVQYIPVYLEIEGKPVKLLLTLTAGQKSFDKLRPSYYQGASGAIIFFDKSDRKSFDSVTDWMEDFKKFVHAPVPIALAGISIKPSMHREPDIISSDEAQSLADKLDLPFFDSPYPPSRNKFEDFLFQLTHQVIKSRTHEKDKSRS